MKLALHALFFCHVTSVSDLEDGLNIVLKIIRTEAQKENGKRKY